MQCLWVLSLSFAVLQMCVCVWSVDTCVYTKLTFRLHHTWHSCSVFTALWYDCSFEKLIFYFHQTPSWLRLVWTNSPVFSPTWYGPVGTTVPELHRIQRIIDTRQVPEYPDSTISKVHIKMMDDHDVK